MNDSAPEKQFQAFIKNIPGMVYRANADWTAEILSNAETLCGYSNDEINSMKHGWLDLVHPDDLALVEKDGAALARDHRSFVQTYRIISRDGQTIWVEDRKTSIFSDDGKFEGIEGVVFDITDRKRAEESLQMSESQLLMVTDNIPAYIAFVDTGLVYRFVNKAYEVLYKKPRSEIVGQHARVVLGDEYFERAGARMKAAASGERLSFETSFPVGDRQLLLTVEYMPFIEDGGEVKGFFILASDITARKQAEDLFIRNDRLESLGILAGGIAHDFNNLLGSIFGYLEVAKTMSDSESVREMLVNAGSTITRARTLTGQLMTFARGGSPDKKSSPVIPFLEETVRFSLSGSGMRCTFHYPKDLWYAQYDAGQICQVIDNLIINARQAANETGELEVNAENVALKKNDLTELDEGSYVRISIRDPGAGIEPELRNRIFDPFFTTKSTGRGLGLATAYSIMRKHGGTITVESVQGKGSIFHMYLPAGKNEPERKKEPLKMDPGSGKILVMDDETGMRTTLKELLTYAGYTVEISADGKEALDLFLREADKSEPFTALILDLTVPGRMGGLEVLKEIRKINATIPAFVMSGYSEEIKLREAQKLGFTAGIAKPFTIQELTTLLHKHLV